MARKRCTADEIISHLRTVEIETAYGRKIACRKLGVAEQTYHRWKKEYGGCAGYVTARRSAFNFGGTSAQRHRACDAPPDPMDADKELGKGVDLAAQLADHILGLNVTAVPMLQAYSQAIKNGEKHIDAVTAATEAKNSAIELAWESMDHDEVLAVTEIEAIEEIEDDEPDDRDLPPLN